jgi:hypothetical protein
MPNCTIAPLQSVPVHRALEVEVEKSTPRRLNFEQLKKRNWFGEVRDKEDKDKDKEDKEEKDTEEDQVPLGWIKKTAKDGKEVFVHLQSGNTKGKERDNFEQNVLWVRLCLRFSGAATVLYGTKIMSVCPFAKHTFPQLDSVFTPELMLPAKKEGQQQKKPLDYALKMGVIRHGDFNSGVEKYLIHCIMFT